MTPEDVERNDPCPCGSGKKYKKCCLKIMRKRDMLWSTLGRMEDWLLDSEVLLEECDRVMADTNPETLSEEVMLIHSFLFDHRLPSDRSPYELYKDDVNIPKPVQDALENIFFSMFRVVEVKQGFSLVLKDLFREGEYHVLDMKTSEQVSSGDVISARLVPFMGRYTIVAPSVLRFDNQSGYMIERISKITAGTEGTIFDLELAKVLIGRNNGERAKNGTKGKMSPDPEQIRQMLEEKVHSLGIAIDLTDLDERVNNKSSPTDAFPDIFNHRYSSIEEMEETIQLIMELWNNYPREEFDWKTPTEVADIGSFENILMSQLQFELVHTIDPTDYPSPEKAREKAEEFVKEWLDTPQDELDGKSPKEVIIDERRERGITDEEVSLSIGLRPVSSSYEQEKRRELDIPLDALIKAYEDGSEDNRFMLDIRDEKIVPWDDVNDPEDERYLEYPMIDKERVLINMEVFAYSVPNYDISDKLLDAAKGGSPLSNFKNILVEEDLERDWDEFKEAEKRISVLDWLADMDLDLKGKPYLDHFEIRRLEPEEISELDPEIRNFGPYTCMDCGYDGRIKGMFFYSNTVPENALEDDAMSDIMYERFGVTHYGFFTGGGQGAYLTAAQCPKCSSWNVFWDY